MKSTILQFKADVQDKCCWEFFSPRFCNFFPLGFQSLLLAAPPSHVSSLPEVQKCWQPSKEFSLGSWQTSAIQWNYTTYSFLILCIILNKMMHVDSFIFSLISKFCVSVFGSENFLLFVLNNHFGLLIIIFIIRDWLQFSLLGIKIMENHHLMIFFSQQLQHYKNC